MDKNIPAFPQGVTNTDGCGVVQSGDFLHGGGMPLRDYFAAKALPVILSDLLKHGAYGFDSHEAGTVQDTATHRAFIVADAMLNARTDNE